MHERADMEGREWEAFLSAWHDHYADAVVFVKELVEETQKEEGSVIREALPTRLAEAMVRKGSFAKSLGRCKLRKGCTSATWDFTWSGSPRLIVNPGQTAGKC
jgi:hypothetical protein